MRHGSRRGIRHGNTGRDERARQPAATVQEHGDRLHKAVTRCILFLVKTATFGDVLLVVDQIEVTSLSKGSSFLVMPSLISMSSFLLMQAASQNDGKARVFCTATSSCDILFAVDAIDFTRLLHSACFFTKATGPFI